MGLVRTRSVLTVAATPPIATDNNFLLGSVEKKILIGNFETRENSRKKKMLTHAKNGKIKLIVMTSRLRITFSFYFLTREALPGLLSSSRSNYFEFSY